MKSRMGAVVFLGLVCACGHKEKIHFSDDAAPSEVHFIDFRSGEIGRVAFFDSNYWKVATFVVSESDFRKFFDGGSLVEIEGKAPYYGFDGPMFDDDKGDVHPDEYSSNGLCFKGVKFNDVGGYVVYDRDAGVGCFVKWLR